MNLKIKFYFYFLAVSLLPISIFILAGDFVGLEVLWVVLLLAYVLLYFFIRQDFLLPLADVENWIKTYPTDQNMRLIDDKKTLFTPVAKAINHLIDENQNLYADMEAVLNKQIERLSKKSASLEILYAVSAKLNNIHSADELFAHFLDVFINMTDASSGVARSLGDDGNLYLVATQGVIDKSGQKAAVFSADCVCGEVAMADKVSVQFSVHTCALCVGKKSQAKASVGTIFIPLRHHSKTLGVFSLFFDTEPSLAFDERALFESIADNIAIALDKSRLDEQTKRMELSQEGLFLSQEIHDSLAQTIYSLKLQVSVLGDMLKHDKLASIHKKVDNLQHNISQANQELRELMCNFRVPLDPKGIEVSLRNLVNHFGSEEGIASYLQVKGKLKISIEMEMQIMRIAQEALSNIRKHAKAHNVRILLSAKPHCQLLIEDDGVGFKKSQNENGTTGHNIGMNIMQERADRIGAKVEIESEVDEGTRVIVTFKEDL